MIQRMLLEVMTEEVMNRREQLQAPPQPQDYIDQKILQLDVETPRSPSPIVSPGLQQRPQSPSVISTVNDWHPPSLETLVRNHQNREDFNSTPDLSFRDDDGNDDSDAETVEFNVYVRTRGSREAMDVIEISDDEAMDGGANDDITADNVVEIAALAYNNAVRRMAHARPPRAQTPFAVPPPPPPPRIGSVNDVAAEEVAEEVMDDGTAEEIAEEIVDNVAAEEIVDNVVAEEVVEVMEVEYNCPVCYDELLSKSPWIFRCRHVLCGECAARIMRTTKNCPLCQTRAVSRFSGPIYFC